MGRAKITITGTPDRQPKINSDNTVDLLFKLSMAQQVPKGLKSLGITGGNPPHFNGEMKARFLKETLPCVVYYWTINNIQNRHIMVHYMYE